MASPEFVLAGILLLALIVYAVSGGADFGGGVWDLLARGPRARRQRELVAKAIAPIWEANHVWLIFAIVVLLAAFPIAFAAVTTALHVPLFVMLIGVVLRGSAFAFRSHGELDHPTRRRLEQVFAISSVITPVMLGVCVGAVAAGRIHVDPFGRVITDFVSGWLAPFPFAIGFMTLALFAMLAAVYLTSETEDRELRDDFRARALAAAVATGVLALAALLLAPRHAPRLHAGLVASSWSLPFHVATGCLALGTILALVRRRFGWARVFAIGQASLIVAGWGVAQFPFAIPPDLTLMAAAAPPSVLRILLVTLGAGAVVLLPAFVYLYWVFKRRPAESPKSSAAPDRTSLP